MGKYLVHSLYSRNVQILITHEDVLEKLISCKYMIKRQNPEILI